jgi:hypothetical protein
MIIFGFGLALASLVLIPWSIWRLIRHRNRFRWWWAISAPAGIALAILFHRIEYMSSPDLKVSGFPIPGAFFEYNPETGGWVDFIGCLTPIAYFANPLIGLGLPLIPLAVTTSLTRKRDT